MTHFGFTTALPPNDIFIVAVGALFGNICFSRRVRRDRETIRKGYSAFRESAEGKSYKCIGFITK